MAIPRKRITTADALAVSGLTRRDLEKLRRLGHFGNHDRKWVAYDQIDLAILTIAGKLCRLGVTTDTAIRIGKSAGIGLSECADGIKMEPRFLAVTDHSVYRVEAGKLAEYPFAIVLDLEAIASELAAKMKALR